MKLNQKSLKKFKLKYLLSLQETLVIFSSDDSLRCLHLVLSNGLLIFLLGLIQPSLVLQMDREAMRIPLLKLKLGKCNFILVII